jgi:hypothetical protein
MTISPLDPPEEVVPALAGSRCFERDDPHPLRVEASECVPDGAVLPARVHALQDDQHRALGLCMEALLERHDVLLVRQHPFIGLMPLDPMRLRRINAGQADPASTGPCGQDSADGLAVGVPLGVRHEAIEDGRNVVTIAVTHAQGGVYRSA